MRRFLSIMLIAVLIVVPSTAAFAGEIELWHSLMGSKEAARLELIENFQKAYPDINVKDLGYFDIHQLNQKVLTAVVTGIPPELASNHYYFVPRYAANDALQPLDSYFARDGIDPEEVFYSFSLDINRYDGKLYGIPLFNSTRVLAYNKDLFQEAGLDPERPPETWTELVEYGKKLTKWNGDVLDTAGFEVPLGKEMGVNFFCQLLWQKGGDIFNADNTQVVFNSREGVEALQFYADLFLKHKVSKYGFGASTQGGQEPFPRGKAGMRMGGSFDLVYLSKEAPHINYGTALLPRPEDGEFVSLVDSFSVFMMDKAKNKEDAWTFLKYCSSKEAQLAFAKTSFRLPSHLEAAQDPYFQEDPRLKVFAEALANGRSLPVIPEWSEIEDILYAEIEAAVNGVKTPAEALDTAAQKINQGVL